MIVIETGFKRCLTKLIVIELSAHSLLAPHSIVIIVVTIIIIVINFIIIIIIIIDICPLLKAIPMYISIQSSYNLTIFSKVQ